MPNICDPALEHYAEEHTTAFPEYMAELARATRAELPAPGMLTGLVEGRLLETLVFVTGARRILELGTYSGYSALAMAQALPPDGQIVTCEVDPDHAAYATRHIEKSPQAGKIEVIVGPASESLARLDGPFDLVFIDADKTGYRDYYEAALARLAQRGLIVADNTLWSGTVADSTDRSDRAVTMRQFNDYVRDDPRVVCVQLTVRDGITLIRRSTTQHEGGA